MASRTFPPTPGSSPIVDIEDFVVVSKNWHEERIRAGLTTCIKRRECKSRVSLLLRDLIVHATNS